MRSCSIKFALQNSSADTSEVDANRFCEFALNLVCSVDTALGSLDAK